MIDDRKQSETTLEHSEESSDSSEDRVKENNATKTSASGGNSPPESIEIGANNSSESESELNASVSSGDPDPRHEAREEPTLETLELKDLEIDEIEGNSGEGVSDSAKTEVSRVEESKTEVNTPPPHVQAAQLQIMEALQLEIESLKQQLAKQTEQAESVKAQSVRIAADFDNFRKRTQKEKEDLEIFAKCNTITELLPVVDNFERARSQIRPANDGEMAIHKSYQGVYKNLVDCLKRLGVSAMRPEGKEFDPNYHEAMLREATAEYADGAVIEQLVRGYMIGDRVLRHAMVKVAAAPEEETNSSTEGNIDSNPDGESPSES
ncbi:MAG: nucleotide exchange factor GrpE [Cyanobacteria bacterium SBLK]|nr:nucleotide exchange factor GrpE [Cyanobacteria bacterium SBLK]